MDDRKKTWKVKNEEDLTVPEFENKVYCVDNLKLLKKLPSESLDLVYIDPPYMTGRNFKTLDNIGFCDKFESREHYLEWLKVRLIEIHRVLKKTGNLFIHADKHSNHYIKVLTDEVFRESNFRGEFIWKRKFGIATTTPRRPPTCHDTILLYGKTGFCTYNGYFKELSNDQKKAFRLNDNDGRGPYRKQNLTAPRFKTKGSRVYKGFRSPPNRPWKYSEEKMKQKDDDGRIVFPENKGGRLYYKQYLKESKGIQQVNIWDDISPVKVSSKEGTDYPTQKPEALLERIIKIGSNEGDLVADFFCGSGTTPAVARRLGRKYIACDRNPDAVKITKERLNE